jgi:hypothetical protein
MTRKLDVQKVEIALKRAANDAKTGPREARQGRVLDKRVLATAGAPKAKGGSRRK